MKFKVFIISVFFICSLLSGICLAQNKVAIIPLMSDCNAVQTVTSAGGRVWMDRNLGAVRVAQSIDDYQAYGWLYQWGRLADGHEDRSSLTTTALMGTDNTSHGLFITPTESPYDWRSPPNPNLWQGVSGINNPCPLGFRVPTETEWQTEMDSWISQDAAGAFASPLKLVVAGRRQINDGRVHDAGSEGYYWSSKFSGNYALFLYFDGGYATPTGNNYRAAGHTVRCIKD